MLQACNETQATGAPHDGTIRCVSYSSAGKSAHLHPAVRQHQLSRKVKAKLDSSEQAQILVSWAGHVEDDGRPWLEAVLPALITSTNLTPDLVL